MVMGGMLSLLVGGMISSTKLCFGAIEQNAQIITVHAKLPAYLVLIALFQEYSLEQISILSIQFIENGADLFAGFGGDQVAVKVYGAIGGVRGVVLQGIFALAGAVMLQKDKVADGIDKGAEPFSAADALFGAQSPENPEKCLLLHIVDQFGRTESAPKLDDQHLTKIGGKVLLDRGVAGSQALQVDVVKAV
jgi:hypothetical protein